MPHLSRRGVLVAPSILGLAGRTPADAHAAADALTPLPEEGVRQAVVLYVNGSRRRLDLDSRSSLADLLREELGLTGTKIGCNHGQCGACTVHVDGRRVLACLTLALGCEGAHVTTIEGLAEADALHPLQAAFAAHDAFQCGYCTPGQVMSGVACIAEGHAGSEDDIRPWMAGNLCRCGAYQEIVAAILETASAASAVGG